VQPHCLAKCGAVMLLGCSSLLLSLSSSLLLLLSLFAVSLWSLSLPRLRPVVVVRVRKSSTDGPTPVWCSMVVSKLDALQRVADETSQAQRYVAVVVVASPSWQ
jgi:hypothetical protein